MKLKFILSISFGLLWLIVSLCFAIGWARDISELLPPLYVWWVIIGIALLPGFLMSTMFFSNLLHWKIPHYPDVSEETSVLICAHNEELTIARSIQSILDQRYLGHIFLIVVDNASTDHTKQEIMRFVSNSYDNCCVKYLYCGELGKSHALNFGLAWIHTTHFITVDADTCLERSAVQKIMNHIAFYKSSCVAGNLFVQNVKTSIITKMQNYDYLLSIAAVKRFQGSYRSTLVAQGAFSAYQTAAVRMLNGWRDVLGEDIVLTYQLLCRNLSSTYEPQAVGYTTVPATLDALYIQRRRWATGMLEGLSAVPPWRQGSVFSKYLVSVNCLVIYLDLAFLFGLIPGVILALFGYCYLAGILTLLTVLFCILLYSNIYLYQKKLGIPFENSLCGFLCFLFFFQTIQSTAALHGYLSSVLHRKGAWQ